MRLPPLPLYSPFSPVEDVGGNEEEKDESAADTDSGTGTGTGPDTGAVTVTVMEDQIAATEVKVRAEVGALVHRRLAAMLPCIRSLLVSSLHTYTYALTHSLTYK
jgi:hypothetical protein